MNVCIIMPTMRFLSWPRVRAQFEAAMDACPDLRLSWMPVVYHREIAGLSREELAPVFGHRAPRWILPLVIHEEPGVLHIIRKQNAALDALAARGFDGWFSTWSDDNLFPVHIGERLLAAASPQFGFSTPSHPNGIGDGVIVFSHKRGQRAVGEIPYETTDLIAAPENMKVGFVSGEQCFVHTRVMGLQRFVHDGCTDGVLMEILWEQCPEQFRFVPDYFTPFNALQPDRWDEDKLKEVLEAK